MILDELLFMSSDQIKLEVYRSLSIRKKGVYRLDELMEKHFLNYHQITKILQEIMEEVNDEGEVALSIGNGKMTIRECLPKIDEYRLLLSENSIPFQFIYHTLLGVNWTIDDFCEHYGFARSTVSRKLTPLIRFLDKYHLTVQYHPISICGNEVNIRLFYTYVFWLVYRGNEWPFEEVKQERLLRQQQELFHLFDFPNSYVLNERLLYAQAVASYRLQNHHVIASNEIWREFFEKNVMHKLKKEQFNQFLATQNLPREELEYWFFRAFYIGIRRKEFNLLSNNVERSFMLHAGEVGLVELSKTFLETLVRGGYLKKVSVDTQQALFLHMNALFMCFQFFQGNYIFLEDLSVSLDTKNSAYKAIVKLVDEFYTEKVSVSRVFAREVTREVFVNRMSALLHCYLLQEIEANLKITVAVCGELEQLSFRRLNTWLKNFGCLEVVEYSAEKITGVDFLISTSSAVLNKHPEIAGFQWELEYGLNEYYRLYDCLFHLAEKKALEEVL
ncbi:Mga helix-turn-helix domain-containing protein [Pilibacter termitis]|uniref:Mga helix-turn-helix domain-containing protein n=1 Tax=Pilibacter termitis TaxID=263852 RepID=A0A1T4P2R7_9ENTE|nr:helix-turn-helix domain-containing protein [Pilibacter termitis]SJZ85890.1 Mga helix-turn-helix domain-containing protein [Pilibacter termitis]